MGRRRTATESGAMAGKLGTCRCVHGKESKIERGKKIG
jgi:hypothetical protein